MGYFRGLRHGVLLGAALALLYAPEAGAVTRRRLAEWLGRVQGSLEGEGPSASSDNARSARSRSATGRFTAQSKREAGGQ